MSFSWQDFLDGADLLGTQQDERIKTANDALAKAQEKAEDTSNQNRRLYALANNEINNLYGDAADKYDDYLDTLENTEAYNPGTFSFNKDVNDYYSKFANQRANQAMNAIRESNDMFSSDYQDALAAKQQALASEEWDKAYSRYLQDRSQAANEWNMNANAGQQAYNNQYNKNRDLLGIANDARGQIANTYGNYINNIASQNNTDLLNYSNNVQGQAANNLAAKNLIRTYFWIGG